MRTLLALAAGLSLLAATETTEAANPFPYRYRWTDPTGYTYYTPADVYAYRPYGYGSRVSGRHPSRSFYWGAAAPGYGYGSFGLAPRPFDIPPYGFGNPYYTGYNDPLLPYYGPGVQEFLLFGGADFYGW